VFSVRTCILFFCILILTLVRSVGAGDVDWGLGRLWPMLVSQDHMWVGTSGGLYRYDISDDAWLTFTPREGLCDWVPQILGVDQGILWVGTSGGLCNADIQLFDWDVLDTTRGLPSNRVLALAFDEDYVWVGTEGGVARYDPLSEELEIFVGENAPSRVQVNDIAVQGETVWLATEEGVWEFSSEYETWRVYTELQGLISRRVRRIITGSGTLWFLTDAGLARFDAASRTWYAYQIYGLTEINDVALDGPNVWLATDQGVFFYDTALDQWREFQELHSLAVRKVNGITLAQGQIWITTEIGVGKFDDATGTWTLYNVDNGLSSNQVKTIELWGQILFVTSEKSIDYYQLAEDHWYSQPVEAPGPADAGRRGAVISLGGPEGTLFRPTSTVTMRLLGRASYQYERTDEQVLSDDEAITSVQDAQGRTDLVLAASLGNHRTANAFYDDTKFDQEREYGLRYHGAENDVLQEVSLGDMRWGLGRGEMLPTLGLFGAGARVETGARTSRLRRRRLAVALAGGDQTTDFQTDFFTGSSQSVSGFLEDRMYLKRRFYSLVEEASTLSIRPGSDRIYLDDRLEATNTANTQRNFSVAGVIGDFDLLHPVEDYALDDKTGLLDLYRAPSDTAVVVAIFELQGQDGGRREVVLYGDGVDGSVVNRYFLGTREILPQTLSLAILDTQGVWQPLSDFGLDSDGDGAVDGQFVDFYHGILHFPAARPFPNAVYLPDDPQHLFTIQFSFQTSSTVFQLSRTDLVSESERVVVDGQSLRRGEDYILDYRSGSLLFLREGLVESSSRVEVEYEYHRESEDQLTSLGASFSPSDLLSVGVNAARYSPQNGDAGRGSVDLLHTTGELRWDQGPAGMDLLVFGEAAQSAAAESQGTAVRLRASAKNNRLRLLAELEDYEEDFLSLQPRRTLLGQLLRRTRAEARYEQSDLFVLDAGWVSERSLDHLGRRADEQRYQTRGILNRKGYPTVVIAAARQLSGGSSPFPDQTSLRGDLEYQVPSGWVSALRLYALKMTAYLHRRWDNGIDSTYTPSSLKAIHQGEYVRLDVAPKPAFQTVVSLRRDWHRAQQEESDDGCQPIDRMGEAIFTTNCDEIPGLSLYARLEGNSREDMLSGTEKLRAYSLDRHRQVIARIYPGFWQHLLTPLTLELDYLHRWDGQLLGLTKGLSFWERYWSTFTGGEVVAGEDFQSKQVRGELRPSSALSLNLGLERQERDQRQLWSVLQNRIWKYSSKLEMRRASSVVVLNFLRDESEKIGISTRVKNAPSLWWERRWSVGFITKASLFFWRESLREGKLVETSSAISPRLGFTGRWLQLGFLGAVEMVDDLSLTLSRRDMAGVETSTRILGNSLKLDIRPLPMSLLRLQSQLSYTDNEVSRDVLSHNLSLKLAVQF
jgi:hypothetical protein